MKMASLLQTAISCFYEVFLNR